MTISRSFCDFFGAVADFTRSYSLCLIWVACCLSCKQPTVDRALHQSFDTTIQMAEDRMMSLVTADNHLLVDLNFHFHSHLADKGLHSLLSKNEKNELFRISIALFKVQIFNLCFISNEVNFRFGRNSSRWFWQHKIRRWIWLLHQNVHQCFLFIRRLERNRRICDWSLSRSFYENNSIMLLRSDCCERLSK